MLSMSFRQTQCLQLRQQISLSLTQQESLLSYKKSLEERIHGIEFNVEREVFNGQEIIRFSEKGNASSWMTISMFSKEELDLRVKTMSSNATPMSVYNRDPKLYINILYHYKSLHYAFRANGKIYLNPAMEEWQNNIVDYLGILPDKWIAKIVRRTQQAITSYRNRLGIDSAIHNFGEEDIDQEKVLAIQSENLMKLRAFQSNHDGKNFEDATKSMIISHIKTNLQKSDGKIYKELTEASIIVSRSTIVNYRRGIACGKY